VPERQYLIQITLDACPYETLNEPFLANFKVDDRWFEILDKPGFY